MADQSAYTGITEVVLAYARELAALDERHLTLDWPAATQPGGMWHGYDANLRDVTFLLNLRLCELTSELRGGSPDPTRAQHILAQHHRAYRDLTGALAGVTGDEFDRIPVPGEWPLRTIIRHVSDAELGFSLLIGWAVERARADDGPPITMPREEMEPYYATVSDAGTMAEMLDRFDVLHTRIQRDLADLSDSDLEALNVWWEGYEVPVWFRLHRFDAHLREHTIQVDKTLAMLDHAPSEPERLARLLHQSLGELGSALLVNSAGIVEALHALAEEFDAAWHTLAGIRA